MFIYSIILIILLIGSGLYLYFDDNIGIDDLMAGFGIFMWIYWLLSFIIFIFMIIKYKGNYKFLSILPLIIIILPIIFLSIKIDGDVFLPIFYTIDVIILIILMFLSYHNVGLI